MKILIACEFSGTVRRSFRHRGHDAYSCDLIPSTDDSEFHIVGDAAEVARREPWDLMVAHPPCTFLSNSGVRHLFDHVSSRKGNRAIISGEARWKAMREAAAFFVSLKTAPIHQIAIENPVPHRYATALIGPYQQIIQPHQFGHGETKATCLWLKNLPPLMSTLFSEGRIQRVHLESPGVVNGLTRQQRRSLTYSGIAEAMAAQWGSFVMEGGAA